MGFGPYNRSESSQPDNCGWGWIFSPSGLTSAAPMLDDSFRAYVHNDLDVVLLRINSPNFEHGLGKTPYLVDLHHPEGIIKFVTQIHLPIKL